MVIKFKQIFEIDWENLGIFIIVSINLVDFIDDSSIIFLILTNIY